MRQQNWRELAVRLVGNDRQRLLSDLLYPIAHFSLIAAYVTIRSVKTHHWHEKLDRLLGGQTLCRPPFPNIGGTCPPYSSGIAAHGWLPDY